MGSGVFFPICAIPFSLLILVLFYKKGYVENEETRIFSLLILSNFIGLIIEVFCTYASYIYDEYLFLSCTIYKMYLVYLVVWIGLFLSYVHSISSNNRKKKNLKKIFRILLFLEIIIIFILPIELVVENDFSIRYTTGLSVTFTYLISVIDILIIMFMLVRYSEKLRNKKYLPIFTFLVIGGIAMMVQKFYPQLLLMTYMETFVTVIMYFTIENPDMKMIEQLNTAKDEAEKANRAKSDFLSSMSHEIRTPLNAIVGFSECILNEEHLETAKSDAKDIIMASQNLLEIVNGILDISKIEANKMEIVESEYSLRETLESLAKLVIPRIGEKPIEFKTQFAPDIPSVLYGDVAKIKQIITNILTNAVKYTERGIIAFEVNCINKDNICSLVISVEDTGRGIKEDKIDTIFNKFERLEEDRNTTLEGTGLGLAITKRLVEMMGGKIVVQSKYGAGSKFTVYLKQEIRNTPLKQEKSYSVTVANVDFSDKKVLVVDDNRINLKVATRMLTPFKINVEECESGEDCLSRIRDGESYDLIFMDDMMPRLTGTETFHELQKNPSFKTPVVVLTANAIEGMRENYLKEGFSDYLAKPIDKLELERVLGHFLAHTKESEKEDIFEPLPEELFDVTIPLKQDE